MKKIHITLAARDIREEELNGKTAVVIDVLRATSVIVTALSNGAKWVKTVASIDEAMELRSPDVLLGGERHAMPIRGFDFSNSPLEYTASRVQGKGIVLTTTNGTLAVSKCGKAAELLIGSFLNHQATVTYLLNQNKPVELVCAGTNGEFSLDDFLCAGLFCSTLQDSAEVILDDLGKLAVEKWEIAASDVHEALSGATHYNILKSKSFYSDLEYCLTRDSHNILITNQDMKFVKAV